MMTPEEIDALPTYTDAQLLKYYIHCRHTILSAGQAIAHDGRQLTRADLRKVEDLIKEYQQRADPETSDVPTTVDTALSIFGRAR
jgi:hypothetical protein